MPVMDHFFLETSVAKNLALILAGCGLALGIFHALIRWSLRAPRVAERSTPRALALAYSEQCIPSANGKQLAAWFIPATTRGPAPALMLLHGWGGNMETMLPLVLPLHYAGYTLLLFDARSHGGSDRDTFSSMPRFAEDLEHALDWLNRRPEVDPRRIGAVGHSVGAAAALLAASRRDDLAAVVSIAAFSHPRAMMRRLLAAWRVPYIPFGWYVLLYVQHVIGHRFDDIAPINTIARARCPVLLVHGTDDLTVPVAEAEALHARLGAGRGGLLLVRGSHDRYEELDSQIGDVVAFLDQTLKS